ncbi:DEAD/DEAH box helicase [Mesorhizobium sp. ES1-1]|uniref:DEAD/DEAH box helicase n=1 Tax=Mesorhizobium sp. ES1-1 TaxID=2876629 RepID=UPI001CC9753E|nr:DEAD/DEAH box helicase [Mesorhizobium sp. ES1-1]MBZ9678541.1 DEAD/DEAH box helicase [Mesorhizobium sp. ES1-1]
MKRKKSAGSPIDLIGLTTLSGTGVPSAERPEAVPRTPAAAIAARLIGPVQEAGSDGLMFIARSESQAEEVSAAFKGFTPEAQVILLPPWDCLPYDRIQPSRESMGRRAAALVAMAEQINAPVRLVVMSPEAALQRIAPLDMIASGFATLKIGQSMDIKAFQVHLERCGYLMDDRVDEPGEFALLGQGLDIFSPGAPQPYRVLVEDGVIASIGAYDPLSQRTEQLVDQIVVAPSTECLPDAVVNDDPPKTQGMEARLLAAGVELSSVFELLPNTRIVLGAGVDERFGAAMTLIDDARHARDKQMGRKPTEERFYLSRSSLDEAIGHRRSELDMSGVSPTPNFIVEVNPSRAAAEFVADRAQEGLRIVLAGTTSELDRLVKAATRGVKKTPQTAESWTKALNGKPGSISSIDLDIDSGFVDRTSEIAVVATANVFGTRLNETDREGTTLAGEPELRIGDVVLHEDHGIAVLRALEIVEVGNVATDTVRLEFRDGATLLAPVEEFGRIWRYGADEQAVTLDKLNGDGWAKRRAQLNDEIDEAARHLVRLANERDEGGARIVKPPRAAYARFAARFPYPETVDQAAAIASVIDDLSSGKAMNRLICGDVGFGKTEVALRAAATVALNGGQVAVVAPTTVLARQHFETFSRRFEDMGVSVALLSRVVGNAEAKKVKAGLADGTIGIVVATHAIAAKDVAFNDLALLVIDEEHRFGVKLKQQLRTLAPRLHVLSMSATPIPRTLAAAMVGVQEASLLASPPARRRPVRTELAPFDAASLKVALIREHRRAGQSFCVVPRIEDIERTAAELRRLVPELSLLVAHGDMKAAEMDEAMIAFANGDADILLSTNIIENGLDVPRANTIVIFRADRFGLAQLHQLRGRVGRGRAQGHAYLLTEPGKDISPETRSRLSTLLAFDRLGSGLAISSRDLDLRGAGDLVGEEQAGHMKLIGLSLYQKLLALAVDKTRGKDRSMLRPAIDLEFSGTLPSEYVPEPVVRLNLYSRLQRFEAPAEIDAFADELEDRFGRPPPEATILLDLTRLKLSAAAAGIIRIAAGPVAIAIEFANADPVVCARLEKRSDCTQNNGRFIFKLATIPGPERLAVALGLVNSIANGDQASR